MAVFLPILYIFSGIFLAVLTFAFGFNNEKFRISIYGLVTIVLILLFMVFFGFYYVITATFLGFMLALAMSLLGLIISIGVVYIVLKNKIKHRTFDLIFSIIVFIFSIIKLIIVIGELSA